MSEITRALLARLGVDLAKQAIQVHAVDAQDRRVVARALKRDQFVFNKRPEAFSQFKAAHQFGAWMGIVPGQNTNGGKASAGAYHHAR